MPVCHPLSVIHEVTNLDAALRLLEATLAMPVRVRGSGWAAVDNGSVSLRLIERAAPAPAPLRLELATTDIARAAQELLRDHDVTPLGAAEWVAADREEQRFATPHGFELVLSRRYDEDELGADPELPQNLVWHPDASRSVRALLKEVPVVFRQSARAKITRWAEHLALEAGAVEVTLAVGIQAVVQMTPAFQLSRLRQAIERLGYDPTRWEPDFER